MSKTVLLIVEGGRQEPRFFRKMQTLYRNMSDSEIISYNTNIHALIERCFIGDEIDDDLSLQDVLKESPTCSDDDILYRKYTDIYLLFDMDPQDHRFDSDKLRKAIAFFNDSANGGKLYLSYPMFESYRHIPNLETEDYLDLYINNRDIKNYKQISAEPMNSCKELQNVSKIDVDICNRIIMLNLRKANYLVNNDRNTPTIDDYNGRLNQDDIFDCQYSRYRDEKLLPVLNTAVFCIIDYGPVSFFENLNRESKAHTAPNSDNDDISDDGKHFN